MSQTALFKLPDGRAWYGQGPFQGHAHRPEGPAFYVNDFELSDPLPWKEPARLWQLQPAEELPAEALPGSQATPRIQWSKPQTECFKMVFRRIRREVQAGRLKKMVPAMAEQGSLLAGHPLALLPHLRRAGSHAWAYAWGDEGRGFLGLTPELLLQCAEGRLSTMALAGTAKPGGREAFESDAKEIEEHELVVESLFEQLSALGQVKRSARGLLQAGSLLHFHSALELELAQPVEAELLIERLHPTPAVGCLPRDERWMQRLRLFRRQLEVPDFFGAPFGFSEGGAAHCPLWLVVAIRGLGWEQGKVSLPSGCGIVSGSAFDHEWRELRLKREAVLRQLDLEGEAKAEKSQLVATTKADAA